MLIIGVPFEAEPHKVVGGGADDDQKEKTPVPPAVKQVACGHDKEVLQLQASFKHKPVEQKHDRQKDGEIDGVEQHVVKSIPVGFL